MTMSLKQAYRIKAKANRRYWRVVKSAAYLPDEWHRRYLECRAASKRVMRIEDDLIARGKAQFTAMPF